MALLKQGYSHLAQQVQIQSQMIRSSDDRIQKMGSRVGKLEDGHLANEVKIAKLDDVPKKVEAMETRWKVTRDMAQWVLGIVLVALAVAGKVPWDVVTKSAPFK
ncbi:MAG: hypothetical protein HOO99_14620 [Hyphomicrobiaceae bacterium]|nr:hypothetical protein [Hyphomicrobiaceae bacterium]